VAPAARLPESQTADDGPEAGPAGLGPAGLDIADLVRFIAKGLVDKPDEVHVALVEERQASVYELEVAESDLGKIIGRGGKTARARRTLVSQIAPRSRKRILVEILE
jgi:uncharacterized protein